MRELDSELYADPEDTTCTDAETIYKDTVSIPGTTEDTLPVKFTFNIRRTEYIVAVGVPR